MPCRQVSAFNGVAASSGSYATEADCLQACREGACCEGTTCTVKPQCQCQGTGKTFKGVGTVCSPNPCLQACGSCTSIPNDLFVTITSNNGDALSAIGCVFGNTSYRLAARIRTYAPLPCLGSSHTCGPGNDGGLNVPAWWNSYDMIPFGTYNSYCNPPDRPSLLTQAQLYCSAGQLGMFWSCGVYASPASPCGTVWSLPLPAAFSSPSNPLRFVQSSVSCVPFAATLTGSFAGISYTATIVEYVNPLP